MHNVCLNEQVANKQLVRPIHSSPVIPSLIISSSTEDLRFPGLGNKTREFPTPGKPRDKTSFLTPDQRVAQIVESRRKPTPKINSSKSSLSKEPPITGNFRGSRSVQTGVRLPNFKKKKIPPKKPSYQKVVSVEKQVPKRSIVIDDDEDISERVIKTSDFEKVKSRSPNPWDDEEPASTTWFNHGSKKIDFEDISEEVSSSASAWWFDHQNTSTNNRDSKKNSW